MLRMPSWRKGYREVSSATSSTTRYHRPVGCCIGSHPTFAHLSALRVQVARLAGVFKLWMDGVRWEDMQAMPLPSCHYHPGIASTQLPQLTAE
jgi:hypothetical protein